ncbi:NAD(P)H-dependent oxidoreductase subunit E [Tepidiforma sp.]|uniref:NADH-quinone oxidoreductase subunit NuoE family protein n=1 Tax=Tepidiforma sp. TaxID=2682230 RepID=UPI002ADDAA74|nr:NAD(P)H-dependent oxidoreductase subunit E [Tepidiforma sp.]
MAAEPGVQELRELVAEFQPGRGHVMPALHKVQQTYGWIPRTAIEVIARQLNTTPALIYGAVTFYSDFRTHPPAQHEIAWCCGPACRLRGGEAIREAIEEELGIALNEQTPDHRFGLHVGQCNGTCHEAPQIWVDGRVRGNLTPESARELIRSLGDRA